MLQEETLIGCLLLPLEVQVFSSITLQYLYILAPSSSPTDITVVSTTTTSITVNWMYDTSDADGYVVYYNGTAKLVVGGDMKETTLDGLIPGTSYSITVRAYQDILGPPMTLYVTTDNGICKYILSMVAYNINY